MKQSMIQKLEKLSEHWSELNQKLMDPHIIQDRHLLSQLSKEHNQLDPIVSCYMHYQKQMFNMNQTQQLLKETPHDQDMQAFLQEELNMIQSQLEATQQSLQTLLIPKDPDDDRNVFLEIRAGTGGDEAALFAGDLLRMYQRFLETQGWHFELISLMEGEHGGYKQAIIRIQGQAVFSKLKFESGTHRVQRVPLTESQGRVHTSACTVAVLPEANEIQDIDINTADLRIDTYRASGAGGQHVNKTDSAVRITHLPSGVVVECQDERSQYKNKARAMSLLRAKLLSQKRLKQQQQDETRRSLVGSGDRSERIRTYNFPQNRLTDHRIHLTLYKLNNILEGNLEIVIQPLQREYQAKQMVAASTIQADRPPSNESS